MVDLLSVDSRMALEAAVKRNRAYFVRIVCPHSITFFEMLGKLLLFWLLMLYYVYGSRNDLSSPVGIETVGLHQSH